MVTSRCRRPSRARNAPAVSIVFAPDASIATINTLLAHQGLSIVSGPGTAGNFTAELSADAVASGASAESVADGDCEGSECHFRAAGCTLT